MRFSKYIHKKNSRIHNFIANVQNICNPIGREEYNIGRIVLSVSILYSLTKNEKRNTVYVAGKIEACYLKEN